MEEITVRAPATVSNVVCGFDCLGFALNLPHDSVTVRKLRDERITIKHHDDFGLPIDPKQNVAGVALAALRDAAGSAHGFEIEITKGIMPGSGIGSSAASACGAVVAANHLLGQPFSNLDLVRFAMEGERSASGSAHADNAAPCIFGGFTLVRSTEPLDVVSLDFPPLFAVIVHPQIEIKTADARAILPKHVPLADAVTNWSNLGAFVAGLARGDHDLITRSLVDKIIEPARKSLIPEFDKAKASALAAGSIGGGISGSGPSIFFLAETPAVAKIVKQAIISVFDATDLDYRIYVSPVSRDGVRLP